MNHSISDEEVIVFRIAQLFFEGMKVREIAECVNKELRPEKPLTRETVYPRLAKAKELGFVRLVPPIDQVLAEQVADRFGLDRARVRVVFTEDRRFNSLVAESAADWALELIRQVGSSSGKPVGIGLGPGRAARDFCRHLSFLVRSQTELPELRLHAIVAGSPTRSPEYASTSFFNLFPKSIATECVGLFAEPIVPADQFDRIRERPTFAESLEEKAGISVVVSSMGEIDDPHDLLRALLVRGGVSIDLLRSKGWVGSVQYRPYSPSGPIVESPKELRAVTLFELEEFVSLASQKNKHVVLIARQCGACGQTRARSVRPLLTSPLLRVWSELVMDSATANELLRQR